MAQVMTHTPRVAADFDPGADVLYVTYGKPVPGYGDEGPEDIILRYAERDETPIGATIIGYRAMGWPQRKPRLAKVIGGHLHIDPLYVLAVLNQIQD